MVGALKEKVLRCFGKVASSDLSLGCWRNTNKTLKSNESSAVEQLKKLCDEIAAKHNKMFRNITTVEQQHEGEKKFSTFLFALP
jgi:hypothetical protein